MGEEKGEVHVEVGFWRAFDRLLLARAGTAERSILWPLEMDKGKETASAKESSTKLDSHSNSAASSLCCRVRFF